MVNLCAAFPQNETHTLRFQWCSRPVPFHIHGEAAKKVTAPNLVIWRAELASRRTDPHHNTTVATYLSLRSICVQMATKNEMTSLFFSAGRQWTQTIALNADIIDRTYTHFICELIYRGYDAVSRGEGTNGAVAARDV